MGVMPLPVASEAGKAGEWLVVQTLQRDRFTEIHWDDRDAGCADIEASRGDVRLLVQVKTSIHPSGPPTLSEDEEVGLKCRAACTGAIAMEARVVLNSNLELVREIEWRRLT